MSNKHLLTCDCGNSVRVGVSQAGQKVTCTCGRSLTVPSLRAVRQLPVASEKSGAKVSSRKSGWNPAKGAMFAVGALMILGGLLVVAHSYNIYSQIHDVRPSTAEYDQSLKAIETMSPEDLYLTWNIVKTHGLEEAGPSAFLIFQQVAEEKLRLIYTGLGIAAAGFVIAILPVLFTRK